MANYRYRRLAETQRIEIIALHREGMSISELGRRYHVRRATISDLIRRVAATGSYSDRPRPGRPRLSTRRQDQALLRLSLANPTAVSRALAQEWTAASDVQASSSTIRRRLISAGLHGRIVRRVPLLTAAHRRRRLEWAEEHFRWTEADRKRVLFSDECPLQVIQTTQRRYVRRRGGHRYKGSAREVTAPRRQGGGGKVMVWGAFSDDAMLPLHRVRGTLRSPGYIEILQQYVQPHVEVNPRTIFQQDNAPSHRSHLTRQWLDDHEIRVMAWPANSPDLNPIENIWSRFKYHLDSLVITNTDQLFEAANDIARQIPPDELQSLVRSMPRRCAEVIANRGGPTHY